MLFSDVALALGALLSIWLTRRRKDRDPFAWAPLYCGYWLCSVPVIATSGGLLSPYAPLQLVLLFIGGSVLQTRISMQRVFAFVMANLMFWLFAKPTLSRLPLAAELDANLFSVKATLMLTAVFVMVRSLIWGEEKITREAFEQGQQLTEARENLIHTSKIAEMGYLMASMAHELAQPTQVLAGLSTLMCRKIETGATNQEDLRKYAWRSRDAAGRLAQLLREFQDFARKDSLSPRRFDLREAIESTTSMVAYDLRMRRIKVELALNETPLFVHADSTRIEQVLLNLINNARDACLSEPLPSIRLEATQKGASIRLSVTNNGPGIPLELQSRLFQPYFTTKEKGHGTGLGLGICLQIIESHGGRILFSSENDKTQFVVDLPVATGVTAQATA